MRIIAATHNEGKLAELRELIKDYDMELLSQAESGMGHVEIEENGTSCEENSKIKAETICRLSGEIAIADDTGLFVDALDGDPGIHAARYAGEGCSEAANRKKLLENLKDVPFEKRTAKFVTVITVVYPSGKVVVAKGECPGHICPEERGERGFGYDSVFMPENSGKTFAELPMDFKNKVSHRGRALQRLAQLL